MATNETHKALFTVRAECMVRSRSALIRSMYKRIKKQSHGIYTSLKMKHSKLSRRARCTYDMQIQNTFTDLLAFKNDKRRDK